MRDLTGALLAASIALAMAGGQAAAQPAAATAPAMKAPAPPAPAAAAPAAAGDPGSDQTYLLGPADVVEISVLGRPDFVAHERIDENGTIRLPLLGATTAVNKTTIKLGEEIAKALESGGYFSHPIVKVEISSYASRYVTVLGNFGQPGLVPVDRAYRLSEIVARVGGTKETGADYVVLTRKRGGEQHFKIETLATGDLNDDPYVSPGDKIYSPAADLIYISGQVKTPGVVPIVGQLTFRMALSRAGGVTDAGSERALTVTRAGKRVHVGLDEKVLPGDVVVVGERLF